MKKIISFFLPTFLMIVLFVIALTWIGRYELFKSFYHGLLEHIGYYRYIYQPDCAGSGCNVLHNMPTYVVILLTICLIFAVWAYVARKTNLFKFSVFLYMLLFLQRKLGIRISEKWLKKIGDMQTTIDKEGYNTNLTPSEKKDAQEKNIWFGRGLIVFYIVVALLFLALPFLVWWSY